MDKYRCEVCGYIYNPGKGDPDSDVEAGTAWENVPDDWECPVCSASKDDFQFFKKGQLTSDKNRTKSKCKASEQICPY